MYNTKNRYEQGQALRKEIYLYIVSYVKLVGYAPSVTEISEKGGCRKMLKQFDALTENIRSAVGWES